MLETLKARKEALEAQGQKGFTLMEMLIVIAIIAVLVAIAIPIFTAQLDRANAGTDLANIRSGYAQVQSEIISKNLNSDTATTYTLLVDGTVEPATPVEGETYAAEYQTKGKSDAIAGDNPTVGGFAVTESDGAGPVKWSDKAKVTYTVQNGKITKIESAS